MEKLCSSKINNHLATLCDRCGMVTAVRNDAWSVDAMKGLYPNRLTLNLSRSYLWQLVSFNALGSCVRLVAVDYTDNRRWAQSHHCRTASAHSRSHHCLRHRPYGMFFSNLLSPLWAIATSYASYRHENADSRRFMTISCSLSTNDTDDRSSRRIFASTCASAPLAQETS